MSCYYFFFGLTTTRDKHAICLVGSFGRVCGISVKGAKQSLCSAIMLLCPVSDPFKITACSTVTERSINSLFFTIFKMYVRTFQCTTNLKNRLINWPELMNMVNVVPRACDLYRNRNYLFWISKIKCKINE